MKKVFRRISRSGYKLELSKTVPNVDTNVDESKAFHTVSSPDHTDMLAIARRQHRKSAAGPAGPPASPELLAAPASKSTSKTRRWLRLFGTGKSEPKKG